MDKVYFVTTNKLKLSIAKKALEKHGIEIENIDIETPELQAFSSKEIVEYSVKYAFDKIKKPVIKTDVEYNINALRGFPGPYVKYLNKWLTAQDILKLMEGKKDRTMDIIEYMSYYDGKNLKTFSTIFPCVLSEKIYDDTNGSIFDKITIRDSSARTQNQLSTEELESLIGNQMTLWEDFAKYLLNEIKKNGK
jgi:non-canonical purine NTP pyrophosphatase (RdgB/HAM1 family)